MVDILNYNNVPFGIGDNKNYSEFIAQGYKVYPYFVEVHYDNTGTLLEIAIINVMKKLIQKYGGEQ